MRKLSPSGLGGTRTRNLRIRSPPLYPVELQGREESKVGADKLGEQTLSEWPLRDSNPQPSLCKAVKRVEIDLINEQVNPLLVTPQGLEP